jgi:hypothetical protein
MHKCTAPWLACNCAHRDRGVAVSNPLALLLLGRIGLHAVSTVHLTAPTLVEECEHLRTGSTSLPQQHASKRQSQAENVSEVLSRLRAAARFPPGTSTLQSASNVSPPISPSTRWKPLPTIGLRAYLSYCAIWGQKILCSWKIKKFVFLTIRD